jgi:vacuolar iron transporter family protein
LAIGKKGALQMALNVKHESRETYAASHTPEKIASRLEDGPGSVYLKDFVYGAVDGAITTFAIVAGVAGAGMSSGVIIILGLANLVADGFSMAVSNFLGTRAENQLREQTRNRELDEIRKWPQGEREEVRQIYAGKGFDGELLDQVVEVITSDTDRWADTMLLEEHGMALQDHNATKAGIATFVAFSMIGLIPLTPYLVNWVKQGFIGQTFFWSSVLTGVAFFWVGAQKARFVNQSKRVGGIETVAIGGLAAAMAYFIGALLKGLAD